MAKKSDMHQKDLDSANDSPKDAKPRSGSQRREVERAQSHPERHDTGKQLVGSGD